MLVKMLREEGVRVKWERPPEQRGSIGEVTQQVIVQMVASGSLMAIKTAVDRFRKNLDGKVAWGHGVITADRHQPRWMSPPSGTTPGWRRPIQPRD